MRPTEYAAADQSSESRASFGEIDPAFLALLRCPLCRSTLLANESKLSCMGCSRSYPIVLGIPDLRLYEDPLIPLEDDYRKGYKIHSRSEELSFAELVRFYWSLPTYPYTPPDLKDRFVHHVLTDEERVRGYENKIGTGESFLEIGCGTGALLKTAHKHFGLAIGCDVAFRWLLIARKRLSEAGLPAHLVCCCADRLPFPDGLIDSVASVSLLEHVDDAAAVVMECRRVVRKRGRMFVWTSNRFSLSAEPHVRVWGVGFLPRRWMPAYVRWRRGMAYEKKRLLSSFELRRVLSRARWGKPEFSLPGISAADYAHLGKAEKQAARIFFALAKVPFLRQLLVMVSPVLQVETRALDTTAKF